LRATRQDNDVTASSIRLQWALAAAALCAAPIVSARAQSSPEDEALVVRLIHPDRQAARWLQLFQGTRAPHPAWALAAWKRATRDPVLLGKPLEAVIAAFNPEMVDEWSRFHDAELHLGYSARDGNPRWYARLPCDDGTIAAAISARRLTDGADEPPVLDNGKEYGVLRLGPPGAPVAAQMGRALVLASSRELLGRGVHRAQPVARTEKGDGGSLDSGLMIQLDAERLVVPTTVPLELRRMIELLRGLGCRHITGRLALSGERLALELETSLNRGGGPPRPEEPGAVVQAQWLEPISSSNIMAVVTLAFEGRADFWNQAFALSDRVERVDPSRAGLAPLRTRFNLLAATSGARPEADLWPHLCGLTACVLGDPGCPGQLGGALLGLHVDRESNAARLAEQFVPQLCAAILGARPGKGPNDHRDEAPERGRAAEAPIPLGMLGGRALEVCRRGRSVWIGWGREVLSKSVKTTPPSDSLASVCTGWGREGKHAPDRLGAIWPARCWLPVRTPREGSAALSVLQADPPVLWWGWSSREEAVDSVQWPALHERVRRFLDQIPLEPERKRG
jgi:hypothetical protein